MNAGLGPQYHARSAQRFLALGRMRAALAACTDLPAEASVADLRAHLKTIYQTSGLPWKKVDALVTQADRGVEDAERAANLRAAVDAARRALTERTTG